MSHFDFGSTDYRLKALDPTAISAGLTLLKSSKYADLIIKCQDQKWDVHRAIVCSRCPFFEKCLSTQFREAKEGTIDLPDDEPKVVEYLLKYLYTFDYDSCLPKDQKPDAILGFSLFIAADKFGLLSLKAYWKEFLSQKAKNLRELFPESRYQTSTSYLEDVPKFLEHAYSCETPGVEVIRKVAIETLGKTLTAYLDHLARHATMSRLLQQYPQLCLDMVNALSQDNHQRPLQTLMKQDAICQVIRCHPHIGIELVRSLITAPRG